MSQAALILVGDPARWTGIRSQLEADYALIFQVEREGFVTTMIDRLAALVIIDGALPDWEWFATTPKISPATRRIPVILLSDSADVRAASTLKGADLSLGWDEMRKNARRWVLDTARLPDPERMAQLECACQEALPPRAVEGIARFNAGEYYKQHDLFEAQWVETEGPVRDLYRAILQVGVAYYQIERENYRGALKMLQRSVQWLAILPDECQGVNIRKLREDSYRIRGELERLGEARFHELDRSLIRGVDWQPKPAE